MCTVPVNVVMNDNIQLFLLSQQVGSEAVSSQQAPWVFFQLLDGNKSDLIFIRSVLALDSGYTVKYNSLPSGVPSGKE